MTAVASDLVSRPPTRRRPRIAAAGWLALGALIALWGLPAGAQSSEDAIGVTWAVAPAELEPGSAFEIDGVVTIDPANAASAGDGALAWTVTVGPIDDVAIERAACDGADGLSCEAEVDASGADGPLVTFAGVVEDDPAAEVTANVTIAGTIDDVLDRDAILFQAASCGTVEAVTGSPAPGRLPVVVATPDGTCDGTAGTIEATIAPATVGPTEAATPTEAPTEEPTVTPEPTATSEPTETPTATAEPTATVEPTVRPTDVPTEAPTATTEPTATVPPTEAATATAEPTAEPTDTVVPTATTEPTVQPTDPPTEEPAATTEPTPWPTATTPAETPDAPATETPQPVPASDDGSSDTGLWVGVGSLVVLAVAAGAVLYQRRKLSA